MSALTNWFEERLIRYAFAGEQFPTPPSTLWIALHTGDPGPGGDLNEVSAGDYARLQAPHLNWEISGAEPTRATLTARLEWAEAATDWGTITHASIWTGSSPSSNPLFKGRPADERTINEGDTYEVPSGEAIVRVD